MYRFSYVNSIAGKATEVDREMFHKIITDKRIKDICTRIAASTSVEDMGTLKRQLPAFCWHAWFDEGKRRNDAAHPSGLIMIDVDHVDDPRALYNKVAEAALAMGLLAAHVTPSTKGLRLVFARPAGLDLVESQAIIVEKLKLENVDACTKDLARLSFCVPEEYFLYVDENSLFGIGISPEGATESSPGCNPGGNEPHPLTPSLGRGNEGEGDTTNDRVDTLSSVMPPLQGSDSANANKYPTTYGSPLPCGEGSGERPIPYKVIVESLQELLGGIPAHGSRNNFIFSMAAYLRYVCNDDPEWIASILPTYGEAHDKWRRTINSACQRAQYKQMPQIVRKAIENARKRSLPLGGNGEGPEGSNDLPPEMPKRLPKLIRHLVKNVPEVCRPAVANAVFPSLAAHLNKVKFELIDGTEKEATFMCVTMAKQSSGKSAINKPIEYITADIVERDEINRKREQDWKDASANKGANKEKPKRPEDLCVQVLVSDMTNAAFVQRMKDAGGRYLYTNIEELDLLKQLQTNGTKDIGKIICLCFDNGKYGQERVGTQSVTARVDIRWNWNAASTIQKGIQFFKGRLVDGTLSRINFCTIVQDKAKPFRYGRYDEKYAETLKPFITNLNLANGRIVCKEGMALAQKMLDKCLDEGVLSDDEVYQDLAYRAVTIAYLKAMVLYIANDMTWTNEIAAFAEWSLNYDLWCKMHFFGEHISEEQEKEKVKKRRGRQNLLEQLPDSFTAQDAQNVRQQNGLDKAGCQQMLYSWVFRGYIEQDKTMGVYVKTQYYITRSSK